MQMVGDISSLPTVIKNMLGHVHQRSSRFAEATLRSLDERWRLYSQWCHLINNEMHT